MLRLLGIAFIILLAGLAVIFHGEIKTFSDNYQADKQAKEYEMVGDYASAIKVYEEKSKENPDNETLAMAYAKLSLKHGKPEKAVEAYRTLMSKRPNYLPALLAYGDLQDGTAEKRNNVLSLYRKALKKSAGRPEPALLLAVGNVFMKAAGDKLETRPEVKSWLYDWAIYYYRHTLKHTPRLASAWMNIGIAYQQTKRTEKAATSYCNALALMPKAYEARYNLGLSLVELGIYGEGYQQLAQSVKTLSEADLIPQAQALAERVQIIKNKVENSNESGALSADESPKALEAFLSPDCLITGMTGSSEAASAE